MSDNGATERAREPTEERRLAAAGAAETEPDVLLDVPELSVDEIRLAVDGLDADLSLRARLANLLQLDAGVRVHLEGVELDITGVRAEALLKVRLEKLVQILDRALTTIDRNPELIDALARSVGATVDDVHRVAGQVAGPAVHRTADAGEVVDRVVPEVAGGEVERRAPAGADPGATSAGEPPGTVRAAEGERGPGSADGVGSGTGGGGAPDGEASGGAAESGGGARSADEVESGAGAAQLAGQAGQTLRQAGRSVWEAIQGGMSQHRQQRPGR
ncbi:hypothetical protein [Micromonospora humi]|uniref:Uncharacterized protein n=1 Tax=Micromonospora humi TaxID=745366 RepID=A0A1C5IG93_9ACTN|nr:hypothetical protein [Micromonospora humi]SCG57083.1 hypothetical protein GA0070213_105420 [Micromonospora humi]